ncbi:MAG: LptF/LptG family permease [Deltaproteobacteria bacterium]|nr:LptF/LptG family permease [Deltaproteobacteria bacterium]
MKLPYQRTLPRYIARSFLINLGITLLFLTMLLLVTSLFGQIDRIFSSLDGFVGFLVKTGQTLPSFVEMLLPMTVLFATLFTFSGFSRTSELVAMKSIGFGPGKMLAPLLMLMLPVALLAYFNQNYLHVWVQPSDEGRQEINMERHQWQALGNRLFYFDKINMAKGAVSDVHIFHWRSAPSAIQEIDLIEKGHREENTWLFESVRTQKLDKGLWWMERIPSRVVPDEAFPNIFRPLKLDAHHTPLVDLFLAIRELERQGRYVAFYLQEWYAKFAYAYTLFLMVVLGASLTQSHIRRGKAGGEVMLTIFLGASFWIGNEIFQMLGRGGYLTPLLAAWAANLLFSVVALTLFARIR